MGNVSRLPNVFLVVNGGESSVCDRPLTLVKEGFILRRFYVDLATSTNNCQLLPSCVSIVPVANCERERIVDVFYQGTRRF